MQKIAIAAAIAIALAVSVPVVALGLFNLKVSLITVGVAFAIPTIAIVLITGLTVLGLHIAGKRAAEKNYEKTMSTPDKYDYFVSEARRLNLENKEIQSLKIGLNNIKYRKPVKDINNHGVNSEQVYAHQEQYVDQLYAKFLASTPEKDTTKKGTLTMLIAGFEECFPRQSVTWRYAVLSFDEPVELKDKIPYFIRRFKEDAIQKMVDDQEKTNPDNLRSPVKQKVGESFKDFENRKSRIPACVRNWPMHDANKICLIISLIGEDIGIPSEYSDIQLLKDSNYSHMVDENARHEILNCFNDYYGTERQLLAYMKSTLNQSVRAQLLQDYKSALLKAICQNPDVYAEVLTGFTPSNEDMGDIELLGYLESKITEKDSEGKFKMTDYGVQVLLRVFKSTT